MIFWLAAPLLAAAPASAQTRFENWEAEPWHVYQTEDECWMAYAPVGGHEVVIAISRNSYDFYVGVARPDWTWAKDKWRYSVRTRFGKFDELDFGLGNDGPGVSVSYPAFGSRGLKALLAARTLTFRVQAKNTERITLEPTALHQFGACVTSIGGPGGGGG